MILASLVHSPVHASPIFTYGSTSDPPSLPHDSLAEIVTPKGNHKPRENPPNTVPNLPAELDPEPSWSDYSSSESSDSSDNDY